MKFENLDSKKYILIKGASLHNLKNIDVAIEKNKIVVITGVSGSGKSSLAFDTLHAEGQRRYVESLSSYARQFLGKLPKPKVDFIKGISPTIAIEQKVVSSNPRSTVGTVTEIYDYLKLLFARIGKTISPISGNQVKKDSVTDVVDFILSFEKDDKVMIMSLLHCDFDANNLISQGYSRIKIDDKIIKLRDLKKTSKKDKIYLVIDRVAVDNSTEFSNRISDSVQTAFYQNGNSCVIENITKNTVKEFSNSFSLDGIDFSEPNINLFGFNTPYGACEKCEGFGSVIGVSEDLVVPNTALSVYQGAIVCWRGDKMSRWKDRFIENAFKHKFPIHKPYFELSDKQKDILWNGEKGLKGINDFFAFVESKMHKIQYRVMLSRYRGRAKCNVCNGDRLKKEASYVEINKHSITDLINVEIKDLKKIFEKLSLTKYEQNIAKTILFEINSRIDFLISVGLEYLTLNRPSSTLSGGESQRIRLSTVLGSSLTGATYVLDEPTIGLHPKDIDRMISILENIRDLGNTVVVVEHDYKIMQSADQIIDIGPLAGVNGGELVFDGNYKQLLKSSCITGKYLSGKLNIEIPKKIRTSKKYIEIIGARQNNLKNIDVKFPLNSFCVITGVSGSGKSSLLKEILYPAMLKEINGYGSNIGQFTELKGNISDIKKVEYIDQNPIGKSSRSNPATYIKVYDDIRNLLANTNLSKKRGYKAKHFSFNVDGGRCDNCKGEGVEVVQMQFMSDISLVCEHCNGNRFKSEILEIKYDDKTISDILNMTIFDAIEFFDKNNQTKIVKKLTPLKNVGLEYMFLGQSSSTLSGGEAQRVKLASFLLKGKREAKTLFIFDEPSTGLHFDDVKKLLFSLNALIENGHSVIVIEHDLDIIKSADWIVDIGPVGGNAGGNIMFQGIISEFLKDKKSLTAKVLRDYC